MPRCSERRSEIARQAAATGPGRDVLDAACGRGWPAAPITAGTRHLCGTVRSIASDGSAQIAALPRPAHSTRMGAGQERAGWCSTTGPTSVRGIGAETKKSTESLNAGGRYR